MTHSSPFPLKMKNMINLSSPPGNVLKENNMPWAGDAGFSEKPSQLLVTAYPVSTVSFNTPFYVENCILKMWERGSYPEANTHKIIHFYCFQSPFDVLGLFCIIHSHQAKN